MITLNALELFGFKSFADRTRFEFPAGITVVVGPNGSGKSNVVDAIKWVLGEQSVRSLRGREATDVIFAGSTARKPLNAAEVSLVFDNTTRELPVEADEVRIMRRVYRSGESEYLVNGGISRLKDIREILSGTGAATDSYSVIEQGRVDALLVASGKERRAVFEEAAGITKFRSRRAEAIRRLDRTEQNRQRLADIVGEVAARLETVKAQASRARRWRRLNDRLKTLRFTAAAADLVDVTATLERVAATIGEADEQLHAAEQQQAAASTQLNQLATDERQLEPDLAAARQQLTLDRERAAAAEARCDSLRSRRADLEGEVAATRQAVTEAADQLRAARTAIAAAHAEQARVAAENEQVTLALQRQEQQAAGSHQDATASEQELSELRRQLDRQQFDHRQAELVAGQRRDTAAAALQQVETCRDDLEAAWTQVKRLEELIASADGTLTALDHRAAELAGRQRQLEADQQAAAAAVDAAWQVLTDHKARLEATRDRQQFVDELINSHEGLSAATRTLLEEAKQRIPGLLGLPADLIVATARWASLVDIAIGVLGERLVVAALPELLDWYRGWTATEAAAAVTRAGGRVGFIALDRLAEPPVFDPASCPVDTSGLIGRLDRLITADRRGCDPAFIGPPVPVDLVDESADTPATARLCRCLLGRVWVVDSLATARRLMPVVPAGSLLLAEDGCWLSADGGFEIGSRGTGTGLVSRRSERRDLEARLRLLEAETESATDRLRTAQRLLEARRTEQQQLGARQQELAAERAAQRSDRDRLERELSGCRQGVDRTQRQLHDAEAQAVAAADAVRAAAASQADCKVQLAAITQKIETAEANLAAIDQSREQVLAAVAGLQRDQASCRERAAAIEATLAARLATAETRQQELTAVRDRKLAIDQRLAAVDLERLAAGDRFAEACLAAERAARALQEFADRQAAIQSAKRLAAATLESSRQTIQTAGERSHAAALERETASHQQSRILERLQDDYQIDPTVPLPTPATTDFEGEPIEVPAARDELDAAIEEVRRKLGSIGSVNLEALAEAEALAGRLGELEGQLADVTEAKQAVEKLIERIDEESRRLLGDTIERVRGEFRELFERLFGGGQADIVLDPDMDLLETTVEIVARPPGKEPRNISLLSGGEKTMTCVALLLAIFRSRPSPFCVLDEVDAALDEANVDRFVGVLRDFLSATQFIVVTHSKKTMATATTLYGVTMEESGVSKRVAVRFEATAASVRSAAA